MARTFALLISFLIVGNVSCYFIHINDGNPNKVQVNTDDEFEGDVDEVRSVMGFPHLISTNGKIERKDLLNIDQNNNEIQEKQEVVQVQSQAEKQSDKKCAAIGEFCANNSDCCSNSCLGFMKRCVS